MPFKSNAQRSYMHANHPDIAKRWEHESKRSNRRSSRRSRRK